MKKIWLIFICFLIGGACFSQKVTISESEEQVDGMKKKGLFTILELDEDVVRSAWNKKLKEYGGVRNKSGIYMMDQATMASISSTFVKVISKVEPTMKGTKVWYALDLGDAYVSSNGDHGKFREAERILKDFGVSVYLMDINEQIRQAEKVLMSSVRDQERMISKGDNIRSNIVGNRQEKVKLEKRLADNVVEYKQLQSDSTINIQNQAATTETVEKMKKAVEAVRSKISKVE